MIGKLIVWATTRQFAIERMRRVLYEYKITGLKTNISYLRHIMHVPDFVEGHYNTLFIPKHQDMLKEWAGKKEEETENIKLPSSSSMPRKLGKVTIDVGEYFFPFFVTHLSYEEKQARTKQFEKISSILAEYDDYILVGDFNTTDFSEYEIITNANTVFSPTLTLPTHGETCIDNIVYAPVGWSFTPPETVQNNASDHNMVYSTATYLLK